MMYHSPGSFQGAHELAQAGLVGLHRGLFGGLLAAQPEARCASTPSAGSAPVSSAIAQGCGLLASTLVGLPLVDVSCAGEVRCAEAVICAHVMLLVG